MTLEERGVKLNLTVVDTPGIQKLWFDQSRNVTKCTTPFLFFSPSHKRAGGEKRKVCSFLDIKRQNIGTLVDSISKPK